MALCAVQLYNNQSQMLKMTVEEVGAGEEPTEVTLYLSCLRLSDCDSVQCSACGIWNCYTDTQIIPAIQWIGYCLPLPMVRMSKHHI